MKAYIRLFDQYTRRDMSYSGDIFFALRGISFALQRKFRNILLAGLPDAYVLICKGYVLPEVDWYIVDSSGIIVKLDAPGTYNPSTQPQILPINSVFGQKTHIHRFTVHWSKGQDLCV